MTLKTPPPTQPAKHPPAPQQDPPRSVGLKTWLGRHWIVAQIFLIVIAVFTVLRMAMMAAFVDLHATSAWGIASALWVGVRFDALVGLCVIFPQTLQLTLLTDRRVAGRTSRLLLESAWLLVSLFLPLLCVVEFLFFEEFQSRLNYIAFEYLVYPTEVFGNIWESYAIVPLLGVVAVVGGGGFLILRRRFARLVSAPLPARRRYGLLGGMLLAISLLWLSDGMACMRVSPDRVVNECAGNGLYSFVYYAWTCRFDYAQYYVTIDEANAVERVRRRISGPDDEYHWESSNPFDRTVTSARPRREWNVVLILEESLGADFIGALGDQRGLSPRFDALTKQGLLFDNFYATGNRTARALEAVLTSMPPIPTESILKRDHSHRVYTLANVLAARSYETLFITAGRGLFDGVRSFMAANGFNRFIEQSDFEDPVFTNAWGVSDEDLFHRAIRELDELQESGRPFFAVLLTVSNHRPYTFPAGRIANDRPSREHAVQYADWALGDFFETAQGHEFYGNTLFVALGDHGARVYGSQLFPMKSYRVPVLMILPDGEYEGTRCGTLGCSMDVAPTVMGLLGGDYRSVFFGRDVLSLPPSSGQALMQHNHDVALLDSQNRMIVLGSSKDVTGYRLDPIQFTTRSVRKADSDLAQDAISLYQIANRLYYDDRWFPATRGGDQIASRPKTTK